MADALVSLRVPAATKARWVRESRAAGMRLTDWLLARIDPPISMPKITIPAIPFSALKLQRDTATGDVSFDTSVIETIERASGLPVGYFASRPEDAIGELLMQWYSAHLAAGGEPDPVAEDLIAEARAEDERGGGFSHEPGRA